MKKLLIVLGVLALLVVAGGFIVASQLGKIVKTGINRAGPQIAGAPVQLADARISAWSGDGVLTGLTVGNPPGWQTPQAFQLGTVAIDVEPRSLLGDHIIVNAVLIDRPEITYETKIVNSNLQDLMKNIQASAGGQAQAKPQDPNAKPVKIEIKSFRMHNGKITVAGAGNQATLDMPPLVLENLGTREGGLTPEQLAVAIMKEVTAQAIGAAAKSTTGQKLIDQAGGKLGEGLNKLLGGKKEEKKP